MKLQVEPDLWLQYKNDYSVKSQRDFDELIRSLSLRNPPMWHMSRGWFPVSLAHKCFSSRSPAVSVK